MKQNMAMQNQGSIYEQAGGWDGMLALAHAWHLRVLADEVVGHAFRHGVHPQHTERLAAYWAEALGGPPEYSTRYGGETRVVKMHSGNGIHEDMDERAIACFDMALQDVGYDPASDLFASLHDYFATATIAMNQYPDSARDVPDGLSIPRWGSTKS